MCISAYLINDVGFLEVLWIVERVGGTHEVDLIVHLNFNGIRAGARLEPATFGLLCYFRNAFHHPFLRFF